MELSANFVSVITAPPNKGHTPEQLADMCVDKIMHVSDTAPPVIRDQANEYKKVLREVILQYLKKAVNSDRTTVYNALKEAGQPDLAEVIRKL